jgi:hypothetical protein
MNRTLNFRLRRHYLGRIQAQLKPASRFDHHETGPLVLKEEVYYLNQLYQSMMFLSKDTLPGYIFMLPAPSRTAEQKPASLGKYAEVP